MDTRSEEKEVEAPRFYHLELYDSAEDLELFSEEPFRRRDLGLGETSKTQGAEKQKLPSVGNTRGSDKVEDTYCITCCVPIRAIDQQSGDHNEHEIIPFSSVLEIAKDEFRKNVCKLEDQITRLESFSSHLEEIFITIEENFAKQEHNLERCYNDLMLTLEQRYEENMQALGEEKKEKLEGLYEQLVSCGGNLDTCKDLMETIEDLNQGENKVNAIKAAVATSHRLVDFLKKDVDIDLSVPTNFESRVIDFSDIQELMDSINSVPAPLPPCAPVMNTQDPNSATGTSVRVCWSFFSEDIVESYQLYYKRVSNETSKEEEDAFMLNVKETYCTVTNLAPNTQYEFWVKALNRAGVGSASERADYITAPLAPVLKRKEIRSCEHAALVQWESGNTNPVDSYTAELSKLTDGEDGNIITESIVGIPNCEALIQLEPGHNYLLSVKAVNMGGSSERSEPVSILSTGTSFTLNEETAHPLLSVLEDGLTIACCKTESPKCEWPFRENSFTRSIAILGNPISFQGKHYWEVDVNENTEYRVGVAFENVSRDSYLGTSHASWCMRHTVNSSRHTYEFLNNGMTPDITITVPPRRIGLLLDYDKGSLSFFNRDIMQHLYTFHNHFQDFVCPCFALEEPGTLRILNGIAMPTYPIS
ncbi:fibronectin type III and SPRY domain-containing protein 2 [Zootoca vivipara]|uniref:fibronectin type III and SPRY domain-containing protein 2 n=1 Tax=Zootoca vivipara TaxID=8524 RepID=UPI00293B86D0|nr:fibronectin type III and SPRY domain-containing protein 2 [Zootoca vivipara]XP_060138484.1 fibronectin type III and SPRY domain-containing protein 2 [Zootoca vivipara]